MQNIALKYFAIASTAILLSGCWGTLLGVAASGTGSYVAKREYDKSKIKKESAAQKRRDREYLQARSEWEKERARAQTTDDRLKASLSQTYVGGGLTRVLAVNPEIKNGVVTLYGNVPNIAVADRAVEIARKTRGVREVISKLTIVEMDIKPVANKAGILYDQNQKNAPPQANQRRRQPSQQNFIRQAPPATATFPLPTAPIPRPTTSIEELKKVLNNPNYKPKAPRPARPTIQTAPPQAPQRRIMRQLPPPRQVAPTPPYQQQGAYSPQQQSIYPHVMRQEPPKPRPQTRKSSNFRPELIMPEEAASRPPIKAGSRAHWAPVRPENVPKDLIGLAPEDNAEARTMLKDRKETRSFWKNFGTMLGMEGDTAE